MTGKQILLNSTVAKKYTFLTVHDVACDKIATKRILSVRMQHD